MNIILYYNQCVVLLTQICDLSPFFLNNNNFCFVFNCKLLLFSYFATIQCTNFIKHNHMRITIDYTNVSRLTIKLRNNDRLILSVVLIYR